MLDFLKRSSTKKPRIHSRPLIYPEKKLSLFFNAKAGCTFATKWFFYQMEILDEALAYNKFVHAYRRDIYNKSEFYKNELKQVFSNDYTRIKLVRSPYQRAVSSYIHAIVNNHIDDEISDFLDRPLTDAKRFSFEEFISFLEHTGVQYCNPHNRLQALPDEWQNKLSFTYTIKIENSLHEFRKIEKELGLKTSDIEALSQSFHHREKIPSTSYNGNKILGRLDQKYYIYESFYNNSMKRRVADLYAFDFSQYGYKVEEI